MAENADGQNWVVGASVADEDRLGRLKSVLEESFVIVEHRFYFGSRAPLRRRRWTDLRISMRLFAVAFVLVMSGCASTRTLTSDAVAFANLQVAVRECREGRTARDELLQTFRGYQERLDRRKEELVSERARIAARRAQGEDIQALQADFQAHLVTVHDEYTKLQKNLTEAEIRRADQIRVRLRGILREEARARGINLVSDSDVALNDGRRYIDLTADVIRAADATDGSRRSATDAIGSQP